MVRVLIMMLILGITIYNNITREKDRVETYWIIMEVIMLVLMAVVLAYSKVKKFKYRYQSSSKKLLTFSEEMQMK